VLRLPAAGQHNRRIGESLCVSEETVKTRIENIPANSKPTIVRMQSASPFSAVSSTDCEVTSITGEALFRLRFRKLPMGPWH
jgi:hypothetical protein